MHNDLCRCSFSDGSVRYLHLNRPAPACPHQVSAFGCDLVAREQFVDFSSAFAPSSRAPAPPLQFDRWKAGNRVCAAAFRCKRVYVRPCYINKTTSSTLVTAQKHLVACKNPCTKGPGARSSRTHAKPNGVVGLLTRLTPKIKSSSRDMKHEVGGGDSTGGVDWCVLPAKLMCRP